MWGGLWEGRCFGILTFKNVFCLYVVYHVEQIIIKLTCIHFIMYLFFVVVVDFNHF